MEGQAMTPMSLEVRVETIARACHEANRAWCASHGDESQRPWEEADEWQRQSAIAGVAFALTGATPEEQHRAWLEAKLREGWRYGGVKNAERKTRPCIVADYAKLPPFQRVKDGLFIAVVGALAPALGLSDADLCRCGDAHWRDTCPHVITPAH